MMQDLLPSPWLQMHFDATSLAARNETELTHLLRSFKVMANKRPE